MVRWMTVGAIRTVLLCGCIDHVNVVEFGCLVIRGEVPCCIEIPDLDILWHTIEIPCDHHCITWLDIGFHCVNVIFCHFMTMLSVAIAVYPGKSAVCVPEEDGSIGTNVLQANPSKITLPPLVFRNLFILEVTDLLEFAFVVSHTYVCRTLVPLVGISIPKASSHLHCILALLHANEIEGTILLHLIIEPLESFAACELWTPTVSI